MPWALKCARDYVKVPTNKREFYFVIVYDVLVKKTFIRNRVILQCLTVQGFFNAEYFTLLLMDIVNNFPGLMRVFVAIGYYSHTLLLIGIMYLFTIVVFVSFGMKHM